MSRRTLDPPTANDDNNDEISDTSPAVLLLPKVDDQVHYSSLDPPTNDFIIDREPVDYSILTVPTNNLSLRASLSQSQITNVDLPRQYPRVGVGVVIVESSSNIKTATADTGAGTNLKCDEGVDNSNILIWVGRRKGSHGSSKLALPGGHLEMNESFSDCAIREVQEEMGIVLSKVDFLHVTNDIMTNESKHYITIFMIGYYRSDLSGSPKNCEPDKCEGWEMYTIQNLRTKVDTNDLFIPLQNLLKENPCKIISYCSRHEVNDLIEI